MRVCLHPAIVLILVLAPLHASPTAQGSATPQSQVRVTRGSSADGVLVSEFLDQRTGRSLTARAGIAEDKVTEWLSRLNEGTTPEQDLKALLAAGQSQGLLAASAVSQGVSLIVSSGAPPKLRVTPGTISSRLQDMRTGRIIVAAGATGSDKTKEWLTAVNAAKSEADLAALVSAERSNGLTSVSMTVKGVQITTFWSGTQQ